MCIYTTENRKTKQKKKKEKKKRIQYNFFCPTSTSTKLNTQKFCYINETKINC